MQTDEMSTVLVLHYATLGGCLTMLKLLGEIDWPWPLVTFPFWSWLSVFVFYVINRVFSALAVAINDVTKRGRHGG